MFNQVFMKTIQLPSRILPCLLVLAHSVFAAGYEPVTQPANIGITSATLPHPVEVTGTPRMTKGHPCTLWDQEDIDAIKTQLKTNEELQKSFALLKARGDDTISKPPSLPVGDPKVKGNAGQAWNNASAVADLGILYVLTGNAAYGEYAKTILVGYAKAFRTWGTDLHLPSRNIEAPSMAG
jgi:hypothetical protein